MKSRIANSSGRICVLLLCSVFGGFSQPASAEYPNQFAFSSVQYFASAGATNAVVTVQFSPGSRGWNGTVNFATQDGQGTAVPNQDYVPVTGTLNFSGSSYRTFAVPLKPNSSGQCSIQLALSLSPNDPDALLSRSNAVLNIQLPPPPNLKIEGGAYGTIVVSWPDDGTEPVLERTTTAGTNWEVLGPAPGDGNGRRYYTDFPVPGAAQYRLRRLQ